MLLACRELGVPAVQLRGMATARHLQGSGLGGVLLEAGWDRGLRVHGALIHIDIIDGKLWIQHDGTERGIADELVMAGVPKDRIVLGFRPPKLRPFTDYAAA